MKLYMHQGFRGKAWFVGLDADETINRMWEEIDHLKEQEKNPHFIRDDTRLTLDPGGPLHLKIPFINFTIDDVDFRVQPHQADHVKWQLEQKTFEGMEEIVCAEIGFAITIILPRVLRDKLVVKLDAISKSDAALHASITFSEAKEKANEGGNLFVNGPVDIGGGRTIDIAELKNQRKNKEE